MDPWIPEGLFDGHGNRTKSIPQSAAAIGRAGGDRFEPLVELASCSANALRSLDDQLDPWIFWWQTAQRELSILGIHKYSCASSDSC